MFRPVKVMFIKGVRYVQTFTQTLIIIHIIQFLNMSIVLFVTFENAFDYIARLLSSNYVRFHWRVRIYSRVLDYEV